MSAVQASLSGRIAARARRQALSAGRAALPPPTDRVRTGDRGAALPSHQERGMLSPSSTAQSAAAAPGVREPIPSIEAPREAQASAPTVATAASVLSGRQLSIMRRRQLAKGKRAPAPPAVAQGAAPAVAPAQAPQTASQAGTAPPGWASDNSGRDQARARRVAMSREGRGERAAAPPTRPLRQGTLDYAPKVLQSNTHGGQVVTGSRIGRGTQMTGNERGSHQPISGTQYIGTSDGCPVVPAGSKVGWARTPKGHVVSGTMVRSRVLITGDENGGGISITGEADQRVEDDATPRAEWTPAVTAQFGRQVDPHGHTVFGTNLGRSARFIGSRQRERQAPIESTESGLVISGSAVGRGSRVTGDEDGVCRLVTGDQYLTPASAQAECGGVGGGTAPTAQTGLLRRDPVTGAKVVARQTWGQQRVTGCDLEHHPRVSGDAPGSCSTITGSPYHGPDTAHGWCDPDRAEQSEGRLVPRTTSMAVTGDVPRHAEGVTGTERGSARSITGSPYFCDNSASVADSREGRDALFSVPLRQRLARPRNAPTTQTNGSDGAAAAAERGSALITGSFALSCDRVTGTREFTFAARRAPDSNAALAHGRLTGEGRSEGTRITGHALDMAARITGTEGETASNRNPSERQGKAQAFSGAKRFKSFAKHDDNRSIVTGVVGWSSKTAARVTLSGGAQA